MLQEVKGLLKTNLCQCFLLVCILVPVTSVSAQEKNTHNEISNTVTIAPAITEAQINRYYSQKHPVTRWENLSPNTDFYQSPYQISLFSADNGEDGARLWSQTKSIFAYGFGVIGFISLLPEDISSWDKEEGIFNKWSENIKEVTWFN